MTTDKAAGAVPQGGDGRPSPQALHDAFYERTILTLTSREFEVMAKVEDRAHAIDALRLAALTGETK
jgi:hypothetical protein